MESTANLTPVGPGNDLSVKHGVYSPSIVGKKAEDVRAHVIDAAPWVADPAFAGTLELYCRMLATALLGLAHIEKVSEERGYHMVPPRLVETVNGATRTALQAGSLLGLDPKAKAQIMALSASAESSRAGLESLAAKGAAIRKRRQAEFDAARADDDAS